MTFINSNDLALFEGIQQLKLEKWLTLTNQTELDSNGLWLAHPNAACARRIMLPHTYSISKIYQSCFCCCYCCQLGQATPKEKAIFANWVYTVKLGPHISILPVSKGTLSEVLRLKKSNPNLQYNSLPSINIVLWITWIIAFVLNYTFSFCTFRKNHSTFTYIPNYMIVTRKSVEL